MRKMMELPVKLAVMMLIAALCLGATDMITQEPIARQERALAEALRVEALPGASSFTLEALPGGAPESLLAAYSAPEGYVFEVSAGGFGGPIAVTVGISSGGTVAGVRIGTHAETPGLGAKATDEAFYGQFTGKPARPLSVVKSGVGADTVQAITAATITSQAVTDAVNDAVAAYELVRGGTL